MTFEEYENKAGETAVYPGSDSPLGLMYVALKMNGEAGEFAEHVGKALRDDGLGDKGLTPERRQLLIKEVGDVLWYLSAAAYELDIDLATVAQINLDKLADRANRGKLSGSGDNR